MKRFLFCIPILGLLTGCVFDDYKNRTFKAAPGAILYGTDTVVECKYNVGCYEVQQP